MRPQSFFAPGALPYGTDTGVYLREGAFEEHGLGQAEEKEDPVTAFARRWGDVIKLAATVGLLIKFVAPKLK